MQGEKGVPGGKGIPGPKGHPGLKGPLGSTVSILNVYSNGDYCMIYRVNKDQEDKKEWLEDKDHVVVEV